MYLIVEIAQKMSKSKKKNSGGEYFYSETDFDISSHFYSI